VIDAVLLAAAFVSFLSMAGATDALGGNAGAAAVGAGVLLLLLSVVCGGSQTPV